MSRRTWPARPVPAAVVVDVSWVNGLAAIRSLGRAGAPVIALDHRGARSASGRATPSGSSARIRAPTRPSSSRLLVELGDALGRPTPIFPTHDEQLNAIARNRGELGDRFLCPFPGWDVLADPVEALPARERARRRRGRSRDGPPVVVHRGARRGRGARLSGSRQAVRPDRLQARVRAPGVSLRRPGRSSSEAYRRAEPYAPMVQELIPGGDECLYTLRELRRTRTERRSGCSPGEAAPDTARRRDVPRRRGGLGRGGRRARAPPAPPCRVPRDLAGGVQTRSRATASTSSWRSIRASGSGTASPRPAASTCRRSPTATSSAGRSRPSG